MSIQDFVLLVLTFCSIHTVAHTDSIDGGTLEKISPNWEKREDRPNRLGYLESVLSDLSRYELNKATDNSYTDIYKRRPGWGKRSYPDEFQLNKRRPGWGKRSYSNEYDTFEEKRAPGWGKRSYSSEMSNDINNVDIIKRRPGWGKRSDYNEFEATKRRPGWGKRAPGWGKRASGDCQSVINDIRLLRMKLAMLTDDLPETCPSVLLEEDEDINNS